MRCKLIKHIHIHTSFLVDGNYIRISSDGKKIQCNPHFALVDENILNESNLHINHYMIQSFDFFSKVKMSRGDADNTRYESKRTIDFFNLHNYNDLQDNELKNKKYK
jgi:hypothetical protein